MTEQTTALTCAQIIDEDGGLLGGIKSVHRKSEDSWRHGCRITQVFHRESDNTFWMAKYRSSTDQEVNELREGIAAITQVEPFQETVTSYRPFTNTPRSDLILVRFNLDCHRMGQLDGLFVTTKAELEASFGKRAYFGEVLGKHSDIAADLDASMFEEVSTDTGFIERLTDLLGANISGFNPLEYLEDGEQS
jgi:hypothetical protein